MKPAPLRVLIVDDHPMIRTGLVAAISEMEGIEVAGLAANQEEAQQLVAQSDPDVVLLDIALGKASGLEVNRWLAEHHPTVKVLMFTMNEDPDTMAIAVSDGAHGYLVKGAGPERIERALWAVAGGDVVLDHVLATSMLDTSRSRSGVRPFPQLTAREFEVLELVAQSFDNAAIARRLYLSDKTVRNHVSNILAKLPATSRLEVIRIAHQMNVGT